MAAETGGLSGKPLFDQSTKILREMYILTRVCSLYLKSVEIQVLLTHAIILLFKVFYNHNEDCRSIV